MTFREYCESFRAADIMAHQPEGGYWVPALAAGDAGRSVHTFFYNVSSDPVKDCENRPCYRVSFVGRDGYVSINFDHAQTGHKDRFDKNQQIQQTSGANPAAEQMYSVLKAIGEYVQVKRPEEISWSAVGKSRPEAVNQTARQNVYTLWAIKNLMGTYVPVGISTWMRADAYQAEYGARGYPPFDPAKYQGRKGYDQFRQDFRAHNSYTPPAGGPQGWTSVEPMDGD